MSALVLLNLLNSLRKRDKMLGKPRITLFPNSFNKFNKHEHSCKILYINCTAWISVLNEGQLILT